MSLAIGAPVISNVASTSTTVTSPAATGGTTPYTYAFYRSTVSGFSVGAGNLIQAASASLVCNDSGLTPGTIYYYKVEVVDSAGSPATVDSAQTSTTTLASTLSQNQLKQSAFLGMVDEAFNSNTLAVQIDPSQSGALVAGAALKYSTTAGGMPKVVAATAAADLICGFMNFNIKDQSRVAGQVVSMSSQSNVIYLYAALPINRGQMVTSLPAGTAGGCNGGVVPALGGTIPIAGQALDTVTIGQLVRIQLICPIPVVG